MGDYKNSLKKYKVNCVIDGNVYFSADAYGLRTVRFNDKDNTVEINGKVFTTTKENITYLKAKEDAFIKDLNSAKKQEDGFYKASFGDGAIYYKKLDKFNYQFIVVDGLTIYNYQTTLRDFLNCFNAESFRYDFHNQFNKEKLLPLYNLAMENKEEYIVRLIDFLSKDVKKEDVDFLNDYENNDILYIDKKVYGVEDIADIKDVMLFRHGSMFGYRISYKMKVKIGDKYYPVLYFPHSDNLKIKSSEGQINLSEEMIGKIKVLTGETEENIKTRSLLQLGNFLYCHDISKLKIEQQNKVFNDLSKVSFEDIKALPLHWLEKLSKPQLYDWLQCAGYSGDKKANEFVENLLKK